MMRHLVLLCAGLAGLAGPVFAQSREQIDIPREHRGKAVTITGTLILPAGTAKVPAMIIHHGSGGVGEAREFRYASEIVRMGVAAYVIDSFKGRGITSTVRDQSQVSVAEMTGDALTALKQLATHPRIDAARVGIMGFSKGGSVALETLVERRAAQILPPGIRFALRIPVYPSCAIQHALADLQGAPVIMLLGATDTYVGVAPCVEYAAKLRAAGASVTLRVYPGAKHGFDGDRAYDDPKGENSSRCIYEEQPDGSWKERVSGQITFANGKRNEAGAAAAIAACRTYGVSGGPHPAAAAAAMTDIKTAIRNRLLGITP
jgi:dienelactone hydrolase